MFKIGDFSRLTQVSIRMLRYYDEVGLLKPAEIDRFTGYRFYNAKQITQLNQIVALRDMGFLVAEIAIFLQKELSDAELFLMIEQKRAEILQTIATENSKSERLEVLLKSREKGCPKMNYEVKLKSVPTYQVVALRKIIPAYNQEGILWEKLSSFVAKNKLQCSGSSFAIYHDLECKEAEVDVEVAMVVDRVLEDQGEIKFRETEAVSCMSSMMVLGSFEKLALAYNALGEWIEQNNYEIVGKARQVCHKGPWNETNPEEYLTEIQMPVQKK